MTERMTEPENPRSGEQEAAEPPPLHGDRYDHRDDEQRLADAEERQVAATPVQEGAAELRAEAEVAVERGEVGQDPADADAGRRLAADQEGRQGT